MLGVVLLLLSIIIVFDYKNIGELIVGCIMCGASVYLFFYGTQKFMLKQNDNKSEFKKGEENDFDSLFEIRSEFDAHSAIIGFVLSIVMLTFFSSIAYINGVLAVITFLFLSYLIITSLMVAIVEGFFRVGGNIFAVIFLIIAITNGVFFYQFNWFGKPQFSRHLQAVDNVNLP